MLTGFGIEEDRQFDWLGLGGPAIESQEGQMDMFLFDHNNDIQSITYMQKSSVNRSKMVKKSGCYFLVKGEQKKLNEFCTVNVVGIKNTEQYKIAKVFDPQIIKQYQLESCLQYNQQLLFNYNNMDYVIHLFEVFMKKGHIYMIYQLYETTLVDFIKEQFPQVEQITNVLNDVFCGLLQVYKIQYATRSLRPEHIVYVNERWKIQSFVLHEKDYHIDSELCWSPKFASPEDRNKIGELPEQKMDEQLVWNLGIIGLYMLFGPQFQYENINDDAYIPWRKVYQLVDADLYDFLTKALKVDFSHRLRLKDLFTHKVFAQRCKDENENPFESLDKYTNGHRQILELVESVSDEQIKTIQSLQNCIEHAKYFGEVVRYVQEIHLKTNFDTSLIRYLCFKISYDMFEEIKSSIGKQRRKPKMLKDLEKTLNLERGTFKQMKQKYLKTLRDLQANTSEIAEVRNMLANKDLSDESIWENRAIKIFITMAGCIYTEIAHSHKETLSESKQRTICFYSLAVYLLFYYDHEKFKDEKAMKYAEDGTLKLNRLINEGEIQYLIQLTQKLIKDHFVVEEKN